MTEYRVKLQNIDILIRIVNYMFLKIFSAIVLPIIFLLYQIFFFKIYSFILSPYSIVDNILFLFVFLAAMSTDLKPSFNDFFNAPQIRFDSSVNPKNFSSMNAALPIIEYGFAMFFPAMSGAEP